MTSAPPTSNACFVPRGDVIRIAFRGPQAATVVNGLVTNEVAGLAPGEGCYAVALTPKGKIVADLRIFRTEDAILTDTSSAAGAGWLALVRKYVNPRLARYTDESSTIACIELFGWGTPEVLSRLGVRLEANYSHAATSVGDVGVHVAVLPGAAAVIWCAPGDLDAVRAALVAAGAREGSAPDLDVARVEAGRPYWGIDMDDTMLAQEANMDDLGAISYTKGCYTGQEFVARLHYRGHVNKSLRGLRLNAPVARGAAVVNTDGSPVGDVRSSVVSPGEGALALAMLRREVADGALVRVRTEGGVEVDATVETLPFSRSAT